MKRVVMLIAASLVLTACAGPAGSPDIIIPTSGDSLDRAEYTDAQIETYKQALIFETSQLNAVEGMTFDTNVAEEDWAPYIVRAKAFCDDARTRGWDLAVEIYTEQLLDASLNAMPDAAGDRETLEGVANEIVGPLVDLQLRAMAADGSLCPELAPTGFGTVIDPNAEPTRSDEPLMEGQYFGEGCEGAGNALMALLGILQGIEDGSTDLETFEQDITNIAGGLRYSSMTESDAEASAAMDEGVDALILLLTAYGSGDAADFGNEVSSVSGQALNIIDTCGLA